MRSHTGRLGLGALLVLATACHGDLSQTTSELTGREPLSMGSKNVRVGSVLAWNDETRLHLDLSTNPGYSLGQITACVSPAPFPWTPPGQCPYAAPIFQGVTTRHDLTVPLAGLGAACGGELTVQLFAVILGPDGTRVGDAYAGTFKGRIAHTMTCCAEDPLGCPYGPAGTPLPVGAIEVSLEEYAAIAADESFEPLRAAELESAITTEAARLADARAYLGTALAAHPGLTRLVPVDPPPGSPFEPLADGNYRLPLVAGEEDGAVIVHGKDWITVNLADSLRVTPSRENREKNYRALYPSLAADQREGLPDPGALAGVADADLAAFDRELTRRVELLVPYAADALPAAEVAAKPQADDLDPRTGCRNHHLQNLFKTYEWPLKRHTTPMRRQAARGTCSAFAITAGLETLVAKKAGVMADYSEQELYARAKGAWFPTDKAYGDGLNTGSTIEELIERGTFIDAERRWPYNGSSSRVDDEENERYTHSCDGYSGYCSNTNHQRKLVCTTSGIGQVCGWYLPPGVNGSGYDAVRLDGSVSLWNPLEPENSLAAIRAHLNLGHPVVLGLEIDDLYRAAANKGVEDSYYDRERAGVVNWDEGGFDEEAPVGAHAMVAVGYVSNSNIPENSNVYDAWGGGYLIIKNSWGCKGDGGYMYLAYDWLIDQTVVAHALTAVTTSAVPASVTLSLDKSNIKSPTTVRLTATANARTTKLKIFRGLAGEDVIFSGSFDGGSQEVRVIDQAFESGDENGLYLYVAQATDQFGNVTVSNVVALIVLIEDAPPRISLVAPNEAVAPGTILLSATAVDEVAIAKVQFFRGLQLIGTDTSKPYELRPSIALSDVGSLAYFAIAHDTAGKTTASNVETVTVLPGWIQSFTATPATLPAGGGEVTLSWKISGASSYGVISPGDSFVSYVGTKKVMVTQSTSFELRANTSGGTFTASAPVTVLGAAPGITSFTATPSGASTTLAWSVTGEGVTLSLAPGIGDVTGQTSVVVQPTSTTTYTLTATNAAGTATKSVTVIVTNDTTPPTVSLTADPTMVQVPGSTTLTVTAGDDTGVARVELARDGVVFATGTTATVDFTSQDVGRTIFTATAYDEAGNSASADAYVTVLAADVELLADPTRLVVPGIVNLTAVPRPDLFAVRAEFCSNFGGCVLVDETPAADGSFSAELVFGVEDAGQTVTLTAVVHDAVGGMWTSRPVTVDLVRE
jgi:hypothetical protein